MLGNRYCGKFHAVTVYAPRGQEIDDNTAATTHVKHAARTGRLRLFQQNLAASQVPERILNARRIRQVILRVIELGPCRLHHCDFSPHITRFQESHRTPGIRVRTESRACKGIHQPSVSADSRRMRFQ